MDTLAVTPGGAPAMWTSKFHIVPHLRSIVCGTGFDGAFVGEWFLKVNSMLGVGDVVDLDLYAQKGLRALAAEKYSSRFPAGRTLTIYHFGIDSEDVMTGYAYRSTSGFASERFPLSGIGVKPQVVTPPDCDLDHDAEAIMVAQREAQLARPESERIHIGGDVWVCHLRREGFFTYKAASFADKEETFLRMLTRLRDSKRGR